MLRRTIRFVQHQLKGQRSFVLMMLGLGLFRTAVADWSPVPSGSMHPTILEGDVVLVNRLAYQLKLPLTDVVLARTGDPRRGDVVTFSSPQDGTRLIKRLVALPGDVVEMRDEVLVINGQPAVYSDAATSQESIASPAGGDTLVQALSLTETLPATPPRRVQWLQGVHARRSFGPVTVPADSYLVLGDNRDNSADSRYIGFVPRHLLIGQARHVLVSANILDNWLPRPERFGLRLQ